MMIPENQINELRKKIIDYSAIAGIYKSPLAQVKLSDILKQLNLSVEKDSSNTDKTDTIQALNDLAFCYFYGLGITEDYAKARDLWIKSIKLGSGEAKEMLSDSFVREAAIKNHTQKTTDYSASKLLTQFMSDIISTEPKNKESIVHNDHSNRPSP